VRVFIGDLLTRANYYAINRRSRIVNKPNTPTINKDDFQNAMQSQGLFTQSVQRHVIESSKRTKYDPTEQKIEKELGGSFSAEEPVASEEMGKIRYTSVGRRKRKKEMPLDRWIYMNLLEQRLGRGIDPIWNESTILIELLVADPTMEEYARLMTTIIPNAHVCYLTYIDSHCRYG